MRGFFTPLREAGAVARTMLVAVAAKRWQIDPSQCHVEKGVVIDAAGSRRLRFGELADDAAKEPTPANVPLKPAKDFTLIGTPAPQINSPQKVNGSAQFGIDTKLPGMKIATVAACPVFGGKLASVDDSAALAVKGVRQVVRIEDAVAVIADHMGAAKKGLAALKITWDEGANAHVTTADIVDALATASKRPGVAGDKKGDVDAALKTAAKKIEAVLSTAFAGAYGDGAFELHRACPGRSLRYLGRFAGCVTRAGDRRTGHRPPARQGQCP